MHLVAGVSSDMVNRPLPFGAHPGLAATAYRKTAVATPPHFHTSPMESGGTAPFAEILRK
jgi:hypothetical protein